MKRKLKSKVKALQLTVTQTDVSVCRYQLLQKANKKAANTMTRFKGCFSLRVSTCLSIFTLCGRISGAPNEPVKVKEGNNVTLPCSLSTKENIESKLFDWRKDGQKEVFMYNAGHHYNNGFSDQQDRQFKGRVFHSQDELQHGNASIIIRNTTVADSGNYTCIFPHLQPSQTFHIELVVNDILRDRSEENISGAAKEPSIKILDQTNDWSLLQCVVRGVSPKPEVEWKDGSGNIVPAEEPEITERGGSYDIILNANVTKTDRYRCVVTQKEIKHQIYAETFVPSNGAASKPYVKTVKTKDGMKLQCKVLGVSHKTKLEWKDSSGNTVTADEPKITDRGGSYDIILEAPVTKTDRYRCVVSQKEINHQRENDIDVTHGSSTGLMAAVSVICTFAVVSVLSGVLFY